MACRHVCTVSYPCLIFVFAEDNNAISFKKKKEQKEQKNTGWTFDPSLSSTLMASIWSLSSPEFTFSRGIHTSLTDPSTNPSRFTLALPVLSLPKMSSVRHFNLRYSPPAISSNSNFWFHVGLKEWAVLVRWRAWNYKRQNRQKVA